MPRMDCSGPEMRSSGLAICDVLAGAESDSTDHCSICIVVPGLDFAGKPSRDSENDAFPTYRCARRPAIVFTSPFGSMLAVALNWTRDIRPGLPERMFFRFVTR